jgi:MarR family transcriptional regulator, transcriptional regulator for hemolysin
MATSRGIPIGLQLSRTARTVSHEFERSMAEAGGSASAWQVLLLIRSGQWGTQSGLAEAMGVTAATMTHHLNALETKGLVRRWRDDANKRVQQVELTASGVDLFDRLRQAAMRHDNRLRSRLSAKEVDQLSKLLAKIAEDSGE